jgi:hypothetical protein
MLLRKCNPILHDVIVTLSGHRDLVRLHESQPMLIACGARSGAGGGAQEDAKAFLCALEMVASALQYISQSGLLRERNMTIALTL